MAREIVSGTTSNRIRILLDKTGLTFSSAGLVISTIADNESAATVYAQGSSNIEDITTLGTYAAPTSGKCRFKEVDATNHPGLYEIHLADARLAVANARSLVVTVRGAGISAPASYEIELPAGSSGLKSVSLPSGAINSSTFSSGAITSTAFASSSINASALATDAAQEISQRIALEALTGTGDWPDALGVLASYVHGYDYTGVAVEGSFQDHVITNLNTTVSSRLAAASYTAPLDASGTRSAIGLAAANLDTQLSTIDDFLDTEVAAIKAKTDNLPSDPADASDIATSFGTVNSTLSLIAGYIDTEVGAIKAKTDQLTFTVPGQVDANALTGGLTQADVRTAVGLASANLDTQLSGLTNRAVVLSTQVSTVVSTRRITLVAGAPNDDAYNGCLVVIRDQVTANQKAVIEVEDYSSATFEVLLKNDSVFTPAAGDYVDIIADRASTVFVSIPQPAATVQESSGTRLYAFVGEDKLNMLSGIENDYRAIPLVLTIKDKFGNEILTLADGSLTKTATTISFTVPKALLTQRAEWNWSLRLADSTNLVQLWGEYVVLYAA